MPGELPRSIRGLTFLVRLLCWLSGTALLGALGVIHQGKADDAVAPYAVPALLVFLGLTGVLLLAVMAWMHAAVRNADAVTQDDRRIGPWMAVIWWLIPVFNFFQPVRVMSQTWITSVDGKADINGPAAAPVAGWWMLAAVGALLLSSTLPPLLQPEVTLMSSATLLALALTAWLGALGCLASCVRQIAAGQTSAAEPAAQPA